MDSDFSGLMADVAHELLGEPEEKKKHEWRYGTRGSLSIDVSKGTYFDFELGTGGGVLDLITRETGLEGSERLQWLEQHGLREGNGRYRERIIVETYDYTDEAGHLLFQVCRYDPKDFRQRSPDGNGGWIPSVKGIRQVPYRLPEVLEAISTGKAIVIPEGERDVDNLWKRGIPATCNAGGAGKWRPVLDRSFVDADIIVICDNDEPGHKHAHAVCQELKPVASRVRLLDLKTVWPACPVKGDISDWLEAGGTVEQLNVLFDELRDFDPDEQPPLFSATPYIAPDPASIPKRAWLHGGHYIRDVCTATVAPGGFGKTTLSLFEALTMANAGLRIWYISGEDPKVEIDRRIAAHCQHHNLDLNHFTGKLFVDDKTSFPFFIAKSPRAASVMFEEPTLTAFELAIAADKIDVCMLDPFVSFHAVPENDNGAIDAVCKRLGLIAYRQHCCIEISHHVRKQAPGQSVITVDDTRGGGAIVNAVRSSRVINRMTSAEAERAGIEADKRSSYIRLDRGKRNMAPPDEANWFHIMSVELPNGDNVQSLQPWEFPAPKQFSQADIDWVKSMLRQKPRRADTRADDWLGRDIAKRFALEIKGKENRSNVIWIQNELKKMRKRKHIDIFETKDENRKDREFYKVVEKEDKTDKESNVVKLKFEDVDDEIDDV